MPQTIVVLGATGTQGASVVDTFLPMAPAWHIRAVTRNPDSAASKSLSAKGVEVVEADTGDVTTLKWAFAGATAIFAVTDYWAPFWSPSGRAKVPKGRSLREYGYDEETKHDTNIADAAAEVATLTHFIWSALPSPRKASNGKYSGIHHFDSKGAITEHIRKKQPQLAEKMSVICISFYGSNLVPYNMTKPRKRHDGFTFDRPCDGNVKLPFINTRKDTGPFVKTLVELSPRMMLLAYTAAGRRQVTMEEVKKQFPTEGEETNSIMYAGVIEPKDLSFHIVPWIL